MSPPPGVIGRTLGEFVVRDKIGEGGFGAVYRAEQARLGREAAVKVVHPRHLTDRHVADRLLREAHLASRLDHPYAAHVYACGEEPDGLVWIAMELVRGTPLSALLQVQGPLPVERFAALLDRVAEVVQAAHEQGIVHRDLKPANVMVVARAGRLYPKLLDLGIAKAVGMPSIDADSSGDVALPPSMTAEGVALGSPYYMAPELWVDAANADARADVYALGVLAYETLTGKVPFVGEDRLSIARQHARRPVPPLGGGLAPALDGVIARAMAKKPADRFQSTMELAAAFREAAGLDVEPPPLPRLGEALRLRVIGELPQPIAEAVAALDGARAAHQARAALWEALRAACRWLGVVALAARTRGAVSRDPPAVIDGLRALRRRELGEEEWLALARALAARFAAAPDSHPVPELARLLTAPDDPLAPAAQLLELRAAEGGLSDEEAARAGLERAVPLLEALLERITFLGDYPLVVRRADGRAEAWVGQRRPRRALTTLAKDVVAGHPVLVGEGGRPLVDLWPLAQAVSPSPGDPRELFLIEGGGRRGARMQALPLGFTREDESVWTWLRAEFPALADETQDALAAEERSPYRGLAAFGPADASLFFGREREAEALVNRLRVAPLVVVVGPSGAGKSSFVLAGVVPQLEGWRAVTTRPGTSPRAALDAALTRAGISGDAGEELGARLRRAAEGPDGGPILVVVDQLEELFTQCTDPAERRAYAEALAGAARAAEDPVRVVATLRDDFLARAAELPALRDRLPGALTILGTPVAEDLLRIVAEPARRTGWEFDDQELPARMVADVAERPGALALLSFTASRLWEARDRHFRQLLGKAYEAMGGVGGALAEHAERTLAAMTADEQRLVREAFRHLVTAEGTRASLAPAELRRVLASPAADSVVEQLLAARLLTVADDAAGERIEVIHEALLAAWPRLVAWRREDAEGARLRDQLRIAARQWRDRDRPRGLLWRDDALAEYRVWRSRHPGPLPEVEEAFAAASLRDAARGRRFRRTVVGAIILGLTGGVLAMASLRARARDAAAAAHASYVDSLEEQGRQAFLDGDSARALVYLAKARQEGADDLALRFLIARSLRLVQSLGPVLQHDDAVAVVRFSPDGKRLVTAGDDGTARVWDTASGALATTLVGHRAGITAVGISPDGAVVATAGVDGTARLWDLATGKSRAILDAKAGAVLAAALSPDGSLLLTAHQDKTARVWNASSGAPMLLLKGHSAQVDIARFSPDGTRILTAARDGRLRLWDAAGGDLLWTADVVPGGGRISSAVFTRDGTSIVTAARSESKVWDATTGALRSSCEATLSARRAEPSPDGTRVVLASEDPSVRVCDAATGRLLALLGGSWGGVRAAAFSTDGKWVATGHADGGVRVWDAASGALEATYTGHRGPIVDLSFAPDSAAMASASADHTARIARLGSDRILRLTAAKGPVWMAALADATTLLTVGDDRIRRWDARTGAPLGEIVPSPAHGEIGMARLSSDRKRALLARSGGVAELVDLPSWRVSRELSAAGEVNDAQFDARGDRAVTAGLDGSAYVWDLARPGAPTVIRSGGRGFLQAAFLGDGAVLTVDEANGAALWRLDGSSGQRLADGISWVAVASDGAYALSGRDGASIWDRPGARRVELRGHTDVVNVVAFSDDARLVATSAADQTARVWDAVSGHLLFVVPQPKEAHFVAFSPDGARFVTTGGNRVEVWDIHLDDHDVVRLDGIVECAVPWVLVGGQLFPHTPRCDTPMGHHP